MRDISPKIGETKKILLHLPAGILALQILVEKICENKIAGKIIWQNMESRDLLAQALYSVDWHREYRNRDAYFLTPSDFVLKILTRKSPIQNKYEEWNSLLYQGKPAIISTQLKEDANSATIVCFEKLEIGAKIFGQKILAEKIQNIQMKVVDEESLSSLVEKGLDGAVTRRYTTQLL